jgi:hypothetical protein
VPPSAVPILHRSSEYYLNSQTSSHDGVVSDSRCDVDETCALLGCYAAYSGKSLPTFRGNLSFPSRLQESRNPIFLTLKARTDRFSLNVGKDFTLCDISEQRRSQVTVGLSIYRGVPNAYSPIAVPTEIDAWFEPRYCHIYTARVLFYEYKPRPRESAMKKNCTGANLH